MPLGDRPSAQERKAGSRRRRDGVRGEAPESDGESALDEWLALAERHDATTDDASRSRAKPSCAMRDVSPRRAAH